MGAATGSQVKKEIQESRWNDESYSDKDVGPVVPVKTCRSVRVIWVILLLVLLYVLGYEIYKAKKKGWFMNRTEFCFMEDAHIDK